MKVTTRGRYGLRVMVELAAQYGNGPVLVQSIAASQGISANYIHVLVGRLKSAGLIKAVRGPSGGYELAREPSAITALDVISVLEGNNAPAACVTDASCCERTGNCAAAGVWRDVAAAVNGVLSDVTLQELAARQCNKTSEVVTFGI